MSERTTHARPHRPASATEPAAETTTATAPVAETASAAPSGNGADTTAYEVAGQTVNLPIVFQDGHICNANQAKVLQAAHERQYRNNMNANAKARAERLAKAITDADRAANQPYTAAEIVSDFVTYCQTGPQIGGGPRLGSMERLRLEAAWNAWKLLVNRHNDAIKAGSEPVITASPTKPVALMRNPTKGESKVEYIKAVQAGTAQPGQEDAFHEAALKTAEEIKVSFLNKMLGMSKYASIIQEQLDLLLAEKKATKAVTPALEVTAESLL